VQIAAKKISNPIILAGLVAILAMALSTHLVLDKLRQEEVRVATDRQEHALKLFWQALKSRGGAFRLSEGRLMAGNYRINGNNELPDQIKETTGSNATVFQGDTRVASTLLLPDGRRALGTRLSGPAYDAIFRKGIPYRGDTVILGTSYLTAYDPIRDSQGKIIGALFVGTKRSDYLATYTRIGTLLRGINGLTACIFFMLAFLLLTERRRAEEQVKDQVRFLQEIIDAIPAPVFYKDVQGRFLGCNKVFASSTGLNRELIVGKTVHDIWSKEFADRYEEKDKELLEDSGVQVYEGTGRNADGSNNHFLVNKALFKNQNGSVGGVVGVFLDITDRKEAEEEARNAYQRIADILEFLPDPTYVVNRERRIIAWNRAIENMTGVSKEEILGKGSEAASLAFYGEHREVLIDLLSEERHAGHRYLDLACRGDALCAEGIALMRGEERRLWSVAAPLYDRQGERVGGIQSLRDVTEQRRAEQERSLMEAQMHHSRLMASLLVQLGHDLRTPLTPLFALLPMIRDKCCDPQVVQILDICQSSVSHIQGLTSKALDLARLSSQTATVELVPVPLAGLAENSLSGCAELFAQRGITCRNLIEPHLKVQGTGEQLTLLFDNLLSNAARYAAANGEVSISTSRRDGELVVSVKDDGVGLEPEHASLIFDEFYKVDSSRHDLSTQGLGLAICRRVVGNHKGKIWAESPGKGMGTTIHFTLEAAAA